MNKKAGVSLSLKFVMGLVIAIMAIWVLLTVVNKFIIWGSGKTDSQMNFFNELDEKIKSLGINQQETQIFELNDNYLLIAFNNKDVKINIKDLEIYSGNKVSIDETIKKPPQYENALCLCKTKSSEYLFEDDCLQPEDICVESEKGITNNNGPFFLFGEGVYKMDITKSDKINIKYE